MTDKNEKTIPPAVAEAEQRVQEASERLERVEAQRQAAEARAAEVRGAMKVASRAVEERGVEAVLNPGATADKAVADARAQRDALVAELDAIEEKLGAIDAAGRACAADLATARDRTVAVRRERALAALRARLATTIPTFAAVVRDVYADDAARGGAVAFIEHFNGLINRALKEHGLPELAALVGEGKHAGRRVLAGEEV